MQPWVRRSLYVVTALLLLSAGAALWLVLTFDGARLERVAIDWMRVHHARELVFDGPVELQLWPRPQVAVQEVHLSEAGQPRQRFASIVHASLALRLEPLLRRGEIEIDSVTAEGLTVLLRRDEQGRLNVDDLLARIAGGGGAPASPGISIEHLALSKLQLQVDDALGSVQGRFAVAELSLDRFGPGMSSPLHIKANADLKQPAMNAALELNARLELQASTPPGGPMVVHLDKVALQLRGRGFEFEGLDGWLHADVVAFDAGAAPGLAASRVDLGNVQAQFSGSRRGLKVEKGQLGLARLQLDVSQRKLDFDKLVLRLEGRHRLTTFDLTLAWPDLNVQGDKLNGGPVEGRLMFAGDEELNLNFSSKAPNGKFERITLPALRVEVDGRAGNGRVNGHADAMLALETRPLAAELEQVALDLSVSDPALPPLQLVLNGGGQFSAAAGRAQFAGTVNDQRVDARLVLALGGVRPFADVDARFGVLDLNRFVAAEQRGTAPAPTAAGTPIDLQPLRWADARLRLNAARLLRPPYRVDGFELQAGIDDGALTVQRLAGRAWGGSFVASGSANAADNRLAMRLRANDVDLRGLLNDTLGYDALGGRGRIDADLSSRGADMGALRSALNGSIALALRPAVIRGFDVGQNLRGWQSASAAGNSALASDATRQTEFSQLDASFKVHDGVATNIDLDGRSEFLRLGGEGSIDLGRGRIDYLLRAQVVNTASGRAGAEMVMLNGVTVPIDVSGPFDNPTWQVRWQPVTAAVAALSVPNAMRGAAAATGGVVRGAAGLAGRVGGGVARGPSNVPRGGAPEAQPPPR